MVIPKELKEEYPFESKFLDLAGSKLHYIDEGTGKESFVLVHGNPTWSFFYRNIIKELKKTYRVIAIDHMGCGLSDKPQQYSYTLKRRIDDLARLLENLNITQFNMMVHDWGGAIGMGYATRFPDRLKRLVILNTAAFTSKQIPFTISLCKLPILGPFIVKYLNAFCYPATFMTTVKPLAKNIKYGYLFPYDGAKNRKAISEFVLDIPLNAKHPSYNTLFEIENKLSTLQCPVLVLWGGKDFCFNDFFYNRWKEIFPQAKFKYFINAGHYILEDEFDNCVLEINSFLGVRDET